MTSAPNMENGTQTDTAPGLLESQSPLLTPPILSHESAAPEKRRLLSLSQLIALALAAIWGSAGIYLIFASFLSSYDSVAANGALGTIRTDVHATPADPAGDSDAQAHAEPAPGSGLTTKELQMHQAAILLRVASQLANEARRNEIFSALTHQEHNSRNLHDD